jgi:hypothetical protein
VDPYHVDVDGVDLDADPDSTCYRLIFHTFWLDIYKLMRIRIQLINFDADPDFYLMRMRIRISKLVTGIENRLIFSHHNTGCG